MRALASRSADAAHQIKRLIGSSVESVEQGNRLVAQAGASMGELVAAVQQVTQLIGELAGASGKQDQGLRQVHDTVQRLDGITQQNAALVEQSSAAAGSLKEQAARLNATMQVFRMGHEVAA